MSLADADGAKVRCVALDSVGCQGAKVPSPQLSVPTEVSEEQASQNRVDAEEGLRVRLRVAGGLFGGVSSLLVL